MPALIMPAPDEAKIVRKAPSFRPNGTKNFRNRRISAGTDRSRSSEPGYNRGRRGSSAFFSNRISADVGSMSPPSLSRPLPDDSGGGADPATSSDASFLAYQTRMMDIKCANEQKRRWSVSPSPLLFMRCSLQIII